MGEEAQLKALEISSELRQNGFRVDQAYGGNFKKRFEKANKQMLMLVVLGEDELKNGVVGLKDLDSGTRNCCY